MPLDLKKDDMGDVIKDFYKSKAPQFKGKSKKKRREMAIAAKLSAERGPLPEAAPTNSTGDGVANYIPYLFKNEDDDDLTQDYQTPAEPGEAKFRFSNVYPVLKLSLSKICARFIDYAETNNIANLNFTSFTKLCTITHILKISTGNNSGSLIQGNSARGSSIVVIAPECHVLTPVIYLL